MSRTLTLREELSPNEQKMFKSLGWEYLFDVDIAVMPFYTMAVERAFVEEEETEEESTLTQSLWFDRWFAIKTLKNAIKHLRAGKYRGNDEFERVIS